MPKEPVWRMIRQGQRFSKRDTSVARLKGWTITVWPYFVGFSRVQDGWWYIAKHVSADSFNSLSVRPAFATIEEAKQHATAFARGEALGKGGSAAVSDEGST